MKKKKYILSILIPSILIAPCFMPCFKDFQILWLQIIGGIGTFGALLFLIFDKADKEQEEKEIFWHDHLPYLTIGSPCDPTQNRCDINLLNNPDAPWDSYRGLAYFSISNFSSVNAYDIIIKISTSLVFEENATRSHYIGMIPVTSDSWQNLQFIYSKYHINPLTKEVLLDDFDLCNFTSNCDTKKNFKVLYIRLEYRSTLLERISKKIKSDFKIDLECGEKNGIKSIEINNIVRLNYNVGL